ncbi:hypothetical protein KCU95_g4401, partial [Aureobasidium melanogenum]
MDTTRTQSIPDLVHGMAKNEYPGVSNLIHTRASATYGDPSHPLAFRLGNGGAGHTGILRLLCEYFVVIDGWIKAAMKAIADYGCSSDSKHNNGIFQTRGDGSATFYKELALWDLAGVDLSSANLWRVTKPGTPYEALLHADHTGAYIITDRATYLTAKRDNVLVGTVPFVEGGPELLNPCSALVNIKAPHNALARDFASWLGTQEVQQMVAKYGQRWSVATPIFSPAEQQDMIRAERLRAKL